MEKPPLGESTPKKNKAKGMSRREFLKNAGLAAAAVAAGGVVSSLMERDLEKPGDGMTPETRKTTEDLQDRLENEKMMEEIDTEKEKNIYFGYGNLEDYLDDHPLVKENSEELEKARRYFEKNDK